MDEKVSAISIGNSAIKTKAILKCVVGDSTCLLYTSINADKIRRETGWMPETSFEEGIRKTVRWYVDKLDCSSRGFGVCLGKYKI